MFEGATHESPMLLDVMTGVVIELGGSGVMDGVAVETDVCAEYGPGPFKFTAAT